MTVPSGAFLAERQQAAMGTGQVGHPKDCCKSRGGGRCPYLCVSSVPRGPRPILCKTLGVGGQKGALTIGKVPSVPSHSPRGGPLAQALGSSKIKAGRGANNSHQNSSLEITKYSLYFRSLGKGVGIVIALARTATPSHVCTPKSACLGQ